jgi:hypothetical protein
MDHLLRRGASLAEVDMTQQFQFKPLGLRGAKNVVPEWCLFAYP